MHNFLQSNKNVAMQKIVEHQVYMELKDQGILISDLKDLEYLKLLYNMAIKLLVELKS
jgi:hypothetical protein